MKFNLNLKLLLIGLVGFAAASCGKKGDATPASVSIVGTWHFVKDTLKTYKVDGTLVSTQPSAGGDAYINFKADGTYIARQDLNIQGTQHGTYTVTGTTLNMKEIDDDGVPNGDYITTIKTLTEHNLYMYQEDSGVSFRHTYAEYYTR
nr:lipocalin family protein [uncultured Mucilaginibacter sp.]